ncbi:MAG: hypothetical protein FD170_1077 [Bacteroidetes bacterium]|nr:MAG: hypothetical protein FD170_1077 [Bacteroidota bacterium]
MTIKILTDPLYVFLYSGNRADQSSILMTAQKIRSDIAYLIDRQAQQHESDGIIPTELHKRVSEKIDIIA